MLVWEHLHQVASVSSLVLLHHALPRREQRVIDVQRLILHADAGHYRIAVQEREVAQPNLAQARRVHCRENWLYFARCLKVEIHDEELPTGVQSSEPVAVGVELYSLDGGLLGVGALRRCVFVEHPLAEALVGHLVKIPGADEALSITRQIQRQEGVRLDRVGVVIVRYPQIRVGLDYRGEMALRITHL